MKRHKLNDCNISIFTTSIKMVLGIGTSHKERYLKTLKIPKKYVMNQHHKSTDITKMVKLYEKDKISILTKVGIIFHKVFSDYHLSLIDTMNHVEYPIQHLRELRELLFEHAYSMYPNCIDALNFVDHRIFWRYVVLQEEISYYLQHETSLDIFSKVWFNSDVFHTLMKQTVLDNGFLKFLAPIKRTGCGGFWIPVCQSLKDNKISYYPDTVKKLKTDVFIQFGNFNIPVLKY